MSAQDGARAGYLELLSGELTRVGIRGGLRRRILIEVSDHLACDPGADLGLPSLVAREFADQLGTSRARTAAFRAFAALAVAGTLFVATFADASDALRGLGRVSLSLPVAALLMSCLICAQVALVAGGLGLLRALRFRRQRVLATAEAVVLSRRAAVGLVCGAVTMLALPVLALADPRQPGHAWHALALLATGLGWIAIVAAVPSVLAAARLRPAVGGAAGDLSSDLRPFTPRALRLSAWPLALLAAFGLAVVVAAAGAGADDPYDGALRGLFEAVACLGGFALLGPYLGLWSRRHAPALRAGPPR